MMHSKKGLKLKKGIIVNDLIKKFEDNTMIVKSLNDGILILKKIVIVGILYFITWVIQKHVFITLIFDLTISLSVALYIIKKYAEILYLNSKHLGRNNASEYN